MAGSDGKISPRGREKAELMSQPRPRGATPLVGWPSGVKMVASRRRRWRAARGVVMSCRVDCLSGKGPVLCRSLSSRAWAKRLTSCGGGEDAGVAGDSAHAAGGGVVDGAAEEVVEVGVGGGGALIRRRGRWGRCCGISASATRYLRGRRSGCARSRFGAGVRWLSRAARWDRRLRRRGGSACRSCRAG